MEAWRLAIITTRSNARRQQRRLRPLIAVSFPSVPRTSDHFHSNIRINSCCFFSTDHDNNKHDSVKLFIEMLEKSTDSGVAATVKDNEVKEPTFPTAASPQSLSSSELPKSDLTPEFDVLVKRARQKQYEAGLRQKSTISLRLHQKQQQQQHRQQQQQQQHRQQQQQRQQNTPNTKSINAATATATAPTLDLLDLFKVPIDNQPVDKGSDSSDFDPESWKSYTALFDEKAKTNIKFTRSHTSKPYKSELIQEVVQFLESDKFKIDIQLPTFQAALERYRDSSTSDNQITIELSNEFQQEIAAQKERFQKETNMESKDHYRMIRGSLFHLASLCAKHGLSKPVPVIWRKAIESGIVTQKLLHYLLYAAATFPSFTTGDNTRHNLLFTQQAELSIDDSTALQMFSGSSRSNSIFGDEAENDVKGLSNTENLDVVDELVVFHDLLFKPSERTIVVRVRRLIAQENAHAAEALLQAYKNNFHWRVYSPIIRLYLKQNCAVEALSLYTRVKKLPSVELDAEAIIAVLAGLIELGCFCPNAPALNGVLELGYTAASGPQLWDELVSDMAKSMHEIPSGMASRLYHAIQKGYGLEQNDDEESSSTLLALKPPFNDSMAASDELIVNRVRISHKLGLCPRSGVRLRIISLSEENIKSFHDNIFNLAINSQKEFEKKIEAHDKHKKIRRSADKVLKDFVLWLDRRSGDPFTAIVDGPNVGYFGQNFSNGRFSYQQIKIVVDALEQLHENPLVVLPQKFLNQQFNNTLAHFNARQIFTEEEREIRDDLMKSGKVYAVPYGSLDDYNWMIASVATQTKSQNGQSLDVLADDPYGRWPGKRPMLVSNDQMRDHQLHLLEPMLFRRWYSNYVVHYNLSPFVEGSKYDNSISFSVADSFSREIQGNKTVNGTVWHFPIADTIDEWLCIRLPPKKDKGKKVRTKNKEKKVPTKNKEKKVPTKSKEKKVPTKK